VRLLAPLLPGASYTAEVGTGVQAAGTSGLARPHQWSFATRAMAPFVLGTASSQGQVALAAAPPDRIWALHAGPVVIGGATPVRIATCAGPCTSPAAWTTVQIAETGSPGVAALAVAPDGRLHAVFGNNSTLTLNYATCAAACTTAPGWTVSPLWTIAQSQFSAGLTTDASGRLHLAIGEAHPTGQPNGAVYATCAANCGAAAGWNRSGLIGPPDPSQPRSIVMQRGADGTVHLAWRAAGFVRYARCASDCLTAGGWTVVDAAPAPATTTIRLALTAEGEVLLLHGAGTTTRLTSCQGAGCLAPNGWTAADLGAAGQSGDLGGVDLARGADGRLHLARIRDATNPTAVVYGSCATGCTGAAGWRFTDLATGADYRRLALLPGPDGRMTVATVRADHADLLLLR
jgi:hypothetical protein